MSNSQQATVSGVASSRSTASSLDIPQDTPAVTLREGGTPLVHARLAVRA